LDALSIRNGLEQGGGLLQLVFSFGLECAIRKVQVNWIRQLLVYVDDDNSVGENMNTLKKITEAVRQ
jgi:hypothetical protein